MTTPMVFGKATTEDGSDAWFWGDVEPAGPPTFRSLLEDIDDWRTPGPDGTKERRYAEFYGKNPNERSAP